uniref:Mitochondrial carrier protein n=1 Tax=Percolomonas cosmopolitus TaxID=63605 RepID=A0A7S1KTE3_9EUKA
MPPPPPKEKPLTFIENVIAGTAGGCALTLVGHPFDTVKVRLQTQPKPLPGQKPMFTGVLDCFKQTIQKEGITGLYKGITSPLAGQALLYAICFSSYGYGQKIQRSSPDEELSLFKIFNAGVFSGFASTVIMTPMELVKIQMQLQFDDGAKKYKNPLDCAKKIFAERGIRGIYRGTGSTLVRDAPGSGVYFVFYEIVKRNLAEMHRQSGHTGTQPNWHFLVAGGCAGLFGWMFMMPLDTVKSRLQAAPEGVYKSMADCWIQTLKHDGPTGFYKGFPAVAIRSAPANAACFWTFELVAKWLRSGEKKREVEL